MPDIVNKPENLQNQEILTAPEKQERPAEFKIEKKIESAETPSLEGQAKTEETTGAVSAPAAVLPSSAPSKSPTLEKIENILEEDLEEFYFTMPPEKQQEFKQAGEKAAGQIEIILKGVKIKVKKILSLIVKWLKIIPQVNSYFLEQEAKIKTDEILKLQKNDKQSSTTAEKI